jgi:hypothetical protein
VTVVAGHRFAAVVAVVTLLLTGSHPVVAQPPSLRIVVIEGEDGINIIQQKTASCTATFSSTTLLLNAR